MRTSFLLHFLVSLLKTCQAEVIDTAQGPLVGTVHDGYTSYTGIPYASIRGHDGRFKFQHQLEQEAWMFKELPFPQAAGLAPSWSTPPPAAPARACTAAASCLQLDVHVPAAAAAAPVLAWAPAGGEYQPGDLVRRGVIVVRVRYRPGPIGFLCLGDENIPGNAGAKDLVLALRWIRDNIVAFRGSPDHVTVAGQGFGAAVVEALLLSPMSQSLFHGAILQSGSVLSPWAFNYDATDRAQELATLYSDGEDDIDTVSILMNTDFNDLMSKSKDMDVPYFPFAMCQEKGFAGEEQLLSEAPLDMMASHISNVPVVMGYNSDEGYIFAGNLISANALKRMRKDLAFLLPQELVFRNENELRQVVRDVREVYFSNNLTVAALLAYHRDVYFLQHIYRSALHLTRRGIPVYLYQFSYAGRGGVKHAGVDKRGAAHGDELGYLFPERGAVGDEGAVRETLGGLWTNFVKFLNPTPPTSGLPTWEQFNPGHPKVYNIENGGEMRAFPHGRAMSLWEDVYDQYYYKRQ